MILQTTRALATIVAATILTFLSSQAIAVDTPLPEPRKAGELLGVVYDVGLQFTPGNFSVESYRADQVEYDMRTIAEELRANTVRIEGEDIQRLVDATHAAHKAGLKVYFNPWKMGADADETVAYMDRAAAAAEQLRNEGVKIVFVAGCEYTIFNKGAFPGDAFSDRLVILMKGLKESAESKHTSPVLEAGSTKLNEVLSRVVAKVRNEFKGSITYSSGPWETVDWRMFDIVGVDYYRQGESEDDYVRGLDRYRLGKLLVVMEVGCCAYEGAAARGAGGFAILQGTNPDGSPKYEGGKTPVRSEREQADYVETQVRLLSNARVDGVFIYVFAFPTFPYDENGFDFDLASFSLVKSFPKQDKRSKEIPSWQKKEAFVRLAKVYSEMQR